MALQVVIFRSTIAVEHATFQAQSPEPFTNSRALADVEA